MQIGFPDTRVTNNFQVAYVTTDIDRAVAVFRERFGIPDMLVWRDVSIDVTTPTGAGTSVMSVAFAWVGDLMYEVIEPISGPVDFYRQHLQGDGFQIAFHHLGFEIVGERDDWERFRDEVSASRTLPVTGPADYPIQFIYSDETAVLGHYHEYVWFGPGGKESMADIPRY
tara:strand:- start:2770 stop:3279 length:510 start_codon:yes stop_codon:yes gene_type:complete